MTPELQALADALGPYGVTFIKVATLLFTLRLAIKPFSGWAQQGMERALSRIGDTEDPDDDRIAASLLRSKAYRLTAFLVDMFFSVKLPLKIKAN